MDTSDQNGIKPANEKKAKAKKKRRGNFNVKWTISVFFLSFCISVCLATLSSSLERLDVLLGFVALLVVIAIGVLFDFIGIAVAGSDAANFHSMASRGNPIGKKGVWIVKNADKVSSFCNDVIGDISGILSGAIGATLSVKLFSSPDPWGFWGDLLLTGAISAITVGGKALFKPLAIEQGGKIAVLLARFLAFFSPRDRKAREKSRKKK